jgi:hypothetical protein
MINARRGQINHSGIVLDQSDYNLATRIFEAANIHVA